MMKSNITCPLLPTEAHHDEEQYYLSTSSSLSLQHSVQSSCALLSHERRLAF